jgi:hypothetical protein
VLREIKLWKLNKAIGTEGVEVVFCKYFNQLAEWTEYRNVHATYFVRFTTGYVCFSYANLRLYVAAVNERLGCQAVSILGSAMQGGIVGYTRSTPRICYRRALETFGVSQVNHSNH